MPSRKPKGGEGPVEDKDRDMADQGKQSAEKKINESRSAAADELPPPAATPQVKTRTDARSSECGRDSAYKDAKTLAWERLEHALITELFKEDQMVARELAAGKTVIGRMLRCQDSEADAL